MSISRTGFALVLGGVLSLVAAIPARADEIINYVFSGASTLLYDYEPNSADQGDSFEETITGSFSFDLSDGTASSGSITLTGPAPFAGTYTASGFDIENNFFTGYDTSCPNTGPNEGCSIDINFAEALGASPDSLTIVEVVTNNDEGCSGNCSSDAPPPLGTIIAEPVGSPVPEPSTLALRGSGLLGLIVLARSKHVSAPKRVQRRQCPLTTSCCDIAAIHADC